MQPVKPKPKQEVFDFKVDEVSELQRLVRATLALKPDKAEAMAFLSQDYDRQEQQQKERIAHWLNQSNFYRSINKRPPDITPQMRMVHQAIYAIERT